MIPTHTLRRLTPDDTDAYVALRQEMITTERYAFLGVPGDDHAGAPENVRKSLAEQDSAIFGAFENAALVAVAGLYREKRLKRRHRAGIWGVYTTPAARGRGCSRGVVQACIDLARTWPGVGVVGLSASVRATTAIRLYESLGFVAWGVEPDCTRVDDAPEAEVHMQFTL